MFSILKSLFSAKEKKVLHSLESINVDMHSHLIAGIDDGVKTIDEAIEIITFMQSIGYQKIITTPHIMLGGYDNTPAIINEGKTKLIKALADKKMAIQFEAAAEYYLDEHFINDIHNKNEILTFGKNNLLFELSYMTRSTSMETTFFDLNVAGFYPILAHPERYPYLAEKGLPAYEKIKDAGISFQINMFSLVGYYGKQAQAVAQDLITKNMVDYIGTDIHNSAQIAIFKSCLNSEYLAKILENDTLKNKFL